MKPTMKGMTTCEGNGAVLPWAKNHKPSCARKPSKRRRRKWSISFNKTIGCPLLKKINLLEFFAEDHGDGGQKETEEGEEGEKKRTG